MNNVQEMKKWQVDIQLEEFNYDHIEAYTEYAAIEEAENIVAESYSWASIDKIQAKDIDESEDEPALKVWQVDIKLAKFNYDDIEAPTKEVAIQIAEDRIAERYSWAVIETIEAKQIK